MSDGAPRLLMITPEGYADLLERVDAALRGTGSDADLLLRQPSASDAQLVALGRELRRLTRAHGARLLISRRADVAALLDADGVQLPESGLSVADARALLPAGALIGCSRHDGPGLEDAARQGADYATLSPIFEVPGKGEPFGLERFAGLVASAPLPVVGLGGLDAEKAVEALRAGARGVALSRAILGAGDPEAAGRELVRATSSQHA